MNCDFLFQDPMNMGAILRSAYFFGADRILLLEGDRYGHNCLWVREFFTIVFSCPLSATVSKASAGILEIIPIHLVPFRNVVSLFEVGYILVGLHRSIFVAKVVTVLTPRTVKERISKVFGSESNSCVRIVMV